MVINYPTTPLRRQKLRRGIEQDSSLRAHDQRRTAHQRSADVIDKSSTISSLPPSGPLHASDRRSFSNVRMHFVRVCVCVCAQECVTLCRGCHRFGLELSIDQSGLCAEIKVFLSLDTPVAR